MPNVEIHGYNEPETNIVAGMVAERLRFAPFAHDVVISECHGVVTNLMMQNKPYLRVIDDDAPEAQQVVDLLKPLNIDIEVLLLHAFIPSQ